MKRYEEYKDSGIEWIGEVPGHWQVCPLKRHFHYSTGFTPDSKRPEYYADEGLPWVTIADMKEKTIQCSVSSISETYLKDHECDVVPKGSLLYSFKLSTGKTAFAGCDLYTNEAIASFPPTQDQSLKFLRYASYLIENNANVNIYGAKLLNQETLNSAPLPFPPIEEQEIIANYLDSKTSEIDSLIEQTERSIELLEEYRKSVVSEAVTKGLDPDAPMKNSGIEWIGKVPEHWAVEALGLRSTMLTPMRDKPEDLSGPIPWVRIEDYDGKFLSCSKAGYGVSEETIAEMNLKVYPVGTVLCTSSCDLGKAAIITEPLVSNQRFIGIIPGEKLASDYLYYLMLANAERLNTLSTGTIQANLSRKSFEHLKLPFPELSEQLEIAAFLDDETETIESLISDRRRLIDLLGEYRKSLVSDAVTGKFKVPEAC